MLDAIMMETCSDKIESFLLSNDGNFHVYHWEKLEGDDRVETRVVHGIVVF